MHNVWHDYCTVCCMATANTQKVAISNIRKRVGCLIEPSPLLQVAKWVVMSLVDLGLPIAVIKG